MQIVVLDGFTLNPGDLSWEALSASGIARFMIEPRRKRFSAGTGCRGGAHQTRPPSAGTPLPPFPRLRYIGVLATGYNIVDVDAARERGIPVTNVPAYSTMSVAQVVFAHLFNLTHGMGHHTAAVRDGRMVRCKDFSVRRRPAD